MSTAWEALGCTVAWTAWAGIAAVEVPATASGTAPASVASPAPRTAVAVRAAKVVRRVFLVGRMGVLFSDLARPAAAPRAWRVVRAPSGGLQRGCTAAHDVVEREVGALPPGLLVLGRGERGPRPGPELVGLRGRSPFEPFAVALGPRRGVE